MSKQTIQYDFLSYDRLDLDNPPNMKNAVLLYAFQGLSVFPFSLPFSSTARVKEALRIQYRPLLGNATAGIALVPFFVEKTKKSSRGCVFLFYEEEVQKFESFLASSDCLLWPRFMAYAACCAGNGLVVVTTEDTIVTACFVDYIPQFYKTIEAARSTAEQEKDAALSALGTLAASMEIVFIDERDLDADALRRFGNDVLANCPAYAQLDLSSKGTTQLERREQVLSTLQQGGKALCVCGAVLFLLSCGIYFQNSAILRQTPLHNETLYATAFGENSRQPLASSLAHVRELHAGAGEQTLHTLLQTLSNVWVEGEFSGLAIENLKYGNDSADFTGTSENNENIQKLRAAIEAAGYLPKVENIQRIPGGALRFTMSIPGRKN